MARLFVVSGPSGAGKGTVLALVREARPELGLTVSATTRQPREHEIDGVSYYFIDDEQFSELIDQDAFLEWAEVHGHRYGTLKSEVDKYLDKDVSVFLEIDVQGGLAVREKRPDAVLVFIEPPSMEELERRLRSRKTEDEESIRLRLSNARYEMELKELYDERIVNDDLNEAVSQMIALVDNYESDGGADQDGSH